MRPDRPLETELRALIAVSSAVAAAHRFDEVLDAVGEQACFVLRAASISISRYEVEHDWMRTLANAGELHPGEDARPTLETWPLSPLDRRLVDLGEPYVVSLTDAGIPAAERDFLERIERGSVLACPIPLRRPGLGRAGGVLGRGHAAVQRRARALRRGAVRAGRDRDRPRRAVLDGSRRSPTRTR